MRAFGLIWPDMDGGLDGMDPQYKDRIEPDELAALAPDDPNLAAGCEVVDDHEQHIGELLDDDEEVGG